ncbi:hypothetical protein GDO86_018356 [Hymenochirus boettgeri]|uniref:Uncharacterized protein n=1 Tax=Hymenochirus boettgeri TaxID=247094 RepID=A0A8T2ICX4_9PIPI|nr:hypothetical protein GDO86_018356 [Hymenochirus boettgeri]
MTRTAILVEGNPSWIHASRVKRTPNLLIGEQDGFRDRPDDFRHAQMTSGTTQMTSEMTTHPPSRRRIKMSPDSKPVINCKLQMKYIFLTCSFFILFCGFSILNLL